MNLRFMTDEVCYGTVYDNTSSVTASPCHLPLKGKAYYISCTLLGNRLASVWGRKQAATKESI